MQTNGIMNAPAQDIKKANSKVNAVAQQTDTTQRARGWRAKGRPIKNVSTAIKTIGSHSAGCSTPTSKVSRSGPSSFEHHD